jgi:hypothetical protein
MVTSRFPLEEAERAVRLVGGEFGGEEAIKVVILPWKERSDFVLSNPLSNFPLGDGHSE